MDGNGVWRFPEGSGRQKSVERYFCNIICGSPTTSEVMGLRWDEMIRLISVFAGCIWFCRLMLCFSGDQMQLIEDTFRNSQQSEYHNNPKNWDIRKNYFNHPKIWTRWLYPPYYRVMHFKDADRIANSVDPDQTAPLGAVGLGLHYMTRSICLKTWDHYSRLSLVYFSECIGAKLPFHWCQDW